MEDDVLMRGYLHGQSFLGRKWPWQILYDTRSAHTKNGNDLYSNTFNEFNSSASYKQGRLDSKGVGNSTITHHESEGAITLSGTGVRVHNSDGTVVKSITGNGISGSLWFKLINEHSEYNNNGNGVTLVSYGNPHATNHTGFRLQVTNDNIRLNFGTGKIQPSTAYSLTKDKWYHVYYSFKPQQITTSNTKLWINGVLSSISGTNLANASYYNSNHYIGSPLGDSATNIYIGMVAHYNSHYDQQFHAAQDNYIGQFASVTEMYNWGPPQQKLAVGGDAFIENRLSIGGTHSPDHPLDVTGDINFTGTLRQNNSNLICLGSSSSAGAPLQVLASKFTSNTSPTNNGILLKQEGFSSTNHAIMAIEVANANSGDPFVSWNTNETGGGWCMGIDNSDSDILKIANSKDSLGTDTHMEFSSSGTDFKKAILANGSAGTNGQVLTSTGGGTVSWTTVSGGGGGSSLSGTNTFEWGTGVSGKETNAGKIGYSTFTSGSNGALDIVGAGTSSSNRNVRIYDNIGIGTGSPTSPLHVIGDAFFDGGNIYFNKTSGSVSKITSSSTGNDLRFYSDHWIRFIESDTNAEKLVINGNGGKIGINHSTPDSCLHIASSSGQTITLDGTTRTSYIHYVRGTGHWYAVVDNDSGPNHNMYWYSNTSQTGNPIKQIFRFENDTAGAGSNAIGTFTGQHMSSIVDVTPTNVSNCVGLIVSSNQNDYMTINGGTPLKGAKNIHVNEAIPVVKISTKVQDKACFGVISSGEDSNESGREQRTGRIVGVFHKESGDNRVYINSIGEGGVWVVNTNGNLEAGDYITTSNVSGYGMKQTSEFLANYTVAKITMDCNFNPGQVPVKQIKKVSATNTYYVRSTDNDTCNETFYNTLDDETKALYTEDVRTEMVNDLDSNGVFQWEDTSETELAYNIRYLDADGIETTQENAVHIAAFVGCTYHCG